MTKAALRPACALAILACFAGAAIAAEKKEEKKGPPTDPGLIGEVVQEQSEAEKLLFTEYRKRRTAHILLETSYDDEACKDFIAWAEQAYRDFLKWTGKPQDTDLWGTRAHILLLHNKGEWECLMTQFTRGQPPHIVEAFKNSGGTHNATPPTQYEYSHDGAGPDQDKLSMFHNLNHLFLYGLTGGGNESHLPWLWEAFSWHRSIEIFGHRGNSCFSFETATKETEDRAWNDIDDWVELLKRDVKSKQDEDFILFWHKDLMNIQTKTYVKAWSIVRWLTRDEKERAKFVNFVSMLKSSKDQARALKEIYKWGPEELDKAWRDWIRNQPSRWRKSGK